jgi:hypothetical protein
MFNNYQLEVLQILADKWAMWEKTQVSLFTHEDNLRINELRAVLGLSPANNSCHSCFIDDISVLITAYKNELQTAENTVEADAAAPVENTLVNTTETTTQSGTEGGEGKKRGRKKK